MKTPEEKKYGQRQIRFAEAGILFVLILAVAIFVGMKFTSRQAAESSFGSAAEWTAAGPASEMAAHDPDTAGAAAEPVATVVSVQDAGSTPAEAQSQSPEPALPQIIPYAMAEAAYFEGEYENAAELFTAYTNQHPQNAWGFTMLGLSFHKAGDLGAAESAFQEALALQPEHTKSLINLGRVMLDQGRPQQALPLLEKAVALDPESVDAYRVLGRVYHTLQRKDEAIQSYRQAILRDDQDAWSLNNLGLIHIESEQFDLALKALARAACLRQDIPCIQNNLGIALERSGYLTAATAAYQRALVLDGDYAKADESLARVDGRSDAPGLAELDLMALADQFAVWPATVALADSEPASGAAPPLASATEPEGGAAEKETLQIE